ncbi:GNAT family N-acetyltransferase [Aquabacterium humicola]|uniref:GNAT family N-acetyltransferase n=1 Tax=Aquabacterium humicola TaxID=3237377 RepID=UPI002543BAB7|nr:GNAT family N-acetyltransferase [Rubrivivax pictus]
MVSPPLFEAAGLQARELQPADVPRLQALFDANPDYFRIVNHRDALPDEAQQEFDERPPPSMSYTRHWCAGLFDADDRLQGVVVVVSDLMAPGVWHLTLMLLATALHGRGIARAVFDAIESWAVVQGARWLRLGVVAGNGRAERFWQRCGFTEVCLRRDVDTGGRLNTLRVMVKPLGADGIAPYLALVARDRPEAPLP